MIHTRHHERQPHIIEHGPVGQQLVVLKHDAQLTPKMRNATHGQAREVLVIDDELSPGRPLDHRDQFQQRALAGTRVTGQKDHFVPFDLESDALQRLVTIGIALVDLAEMDHAGYAAAADAARGCAADMLTAPARRPAIRAVAPPRIRPHRTS